MKTGDSLTQVQSAEPVFLVGPGGGMAPTVLTATIANGASLSDAQQVSGRLVGIVIPAAWTAAAITFQGSQDGTNYFDIWDNATATAAERTIASAGVPTAGGRLLSLDLTDWLGVNYLKVRSGVAGAAVNQGAARLLGLVLAS
jgi:hypothetical protein